MALFAMFALCGLGGGEVILILALILILFGAKQLPGLTRRFDRGARDAGRSLGGIYGKPAAQALTPNNEAAELYDPAVFHRCPRKHAALRNLVRLCRVVWRRICKRAGSDIRTLVNSRLNRGASTRKRQELT